MFVKVVSEKLFFMNHTLEKCLAVFSFVGGKKKKTFLYFQIYKLGLEKTEESEIKLPTFAAS